SPCGYDPGVGFLAWGAWALHILGYPDQALESSRRSVALARAQAHPYTLASSLARVACVDLLRGDTQAARAHAEACGTRAAEEGFPSLAAVGTVVRGIVLAAEGRGAEGLARLREGRAAWQATGAVVLSTWILAALAEALGRAGQADEGLSVVAEGLAFARDQGERFYEAELHRLRGELLLLRPEAQAAGQAGAEACFRQALEVACRQQAKFWELRAAMSLSRLYQRQGRAAQARPPPAQASGCVQ